MTRITSDEFAEPFENATLRDSAFGELAKKATHEPVVITRNGRDSLVVVSAEEWERLLLRDRKVGLSEDLSDEWLKAVRAAYVAEPSALCDEQTI